MSRRCMRCRARVRLESIYCPSCGSKLDEIEPGALASSVDDSPSSSPALGAAASQALFVELCAMCSLLMLLAVVGSIVVRLDAERPEYDVMMIGADGILAVVYGAKNWTTLKPALKLPTARNWLECLALAVILMPILSGCFWLLAALGFGFVDYLGPYRHDGWPLWTAFASIAVATPMIEEVLFRGVVQERLERILRPTEALVVQAALFSAMHLSPVILVTHFALGLAFGWLRRRSGSLYPGMAFHAVWNAGVLCLEAMKS